MIEKKIHSAKIFISALVLIFSVHFSTADAARGPTCYREKSGITFWETFYKSKNFRVFFYLFFAIIFKNFDKKFHGPLIHGPVGLGDTNFKILGCEDQKIVRIQRFVRLNFSSFQSSIVVFDMLPLEISFL